ncbi:hypothetical protein L1276_001430 [Flavobacterium sp. HSC-32F16]|uniref:hypothetical protein n=1 Tax=Flavobacterium sp. HSC-32F16 TaxID=2910964 RepID=UPI0020A4E951|nr:hypothetical protein [Flavobacterium sp. HSC-32F16]MCP2026286.1 hypothetical protein [Flavobacterium sp. HSC-32F16]
MKLIQTFFSIISAASLSITIISCKNSKKEIKPSLPNNFTGHWIAKDFVDDIIFENKIKTINNGDTEIIIPSNLKDSVTFINDDLELNKYPAAIINDTLVNYLSKNDTQKARIKNGNLIMFPLDERYRDQEFVKADSALIKKAKEANLAVLHILINKVLSNKKYLSKSSKNEIVFTEDGKVQGLANFKTYYITINGDGANIQDMTAIRFTTVNGSDVNLGILFQKNKIELYDLKLLTRPDEKAYYKKGKLGYSLIISD